MAERIIELLPLMQTCQTNELQLKLDFNPSELFYLLLGYAVPILGSADLKQWLDISHVLRGSFHVRPSVRKRFSKSARHPVIVRIGHLPMRQQGRKESP